MISLFDTYDQALAAIKDVQSIPPDLSAPDRVLLFNDGSQTRILEALCQGPITVRKIKEDVTTTRRYAQHLTGERFYTREVMLDDKRSGLPLVHAGSIFDLSVMNEAVVQELMESAIPIGRILHRQVGALRRDLIGFAFDEPPYGKNTFGASPPPRMLRRVYKMWVEDDAAAIIIERFPIPFMDWLARR
jgi:chorismate-pyruvate lyase